LLQKQLRTGPHEKWTKHLSPVVQDLKAHKQNRLKIEIYVLARVVFTHVCT